MTKDIGLYLEDIIVSCNKIAKYLKNTDKKTFDRNDQLQDAVVNRLLVIGEAVKRLSPEFRRKHPDIEWGEPARTRDLLIHHYDDIEYGVVWSTITEFLPPFKKQVKQLLKELDSKRK